MGKWCDCFRDDLVDDISTTVNGTRVSNENESHEELSGEDVKNAGNCFTFAFGLYYDILGTSKDNEKFDGILTKGHRLAGYSGGRIEGEPSVLPQFILKDDDETAIKSKKEKLIGDVTEFIRKHLNQFITISNTIVYPNPTSFNSDWVVCVLCGSYGHHYLRSKDSGKTWFCENGRSGYLYKIKGDHLEYYKNTGYKHFVCYFEITRKN